MPYRRSTGRANWYWFAVPELKVRETMVPVGGTPAEPEARWPPAAVDPGARISIQTQKAATTLSTTTRPTPRTSGLGRRRHPAVDLPCLPASMPLPPRAARTAGALLIGEARRIGGTVPPIPLSEITVPGFLIGTACGRAAAEPTKDQTL